MTHKNLPDELCGCCNYEYLLLIVSLLTEGTISIIAQNAPFGVGLDTKAQMNNGF